MGRGTGSSCGWLGWSRETEKPSRRRSMTSGGVAKCIVAVPSQLSAIFGSTVRAIQIGKDNGLDTTAWEEAAARACANLSPILTTTA